MNTWKLVYELRQNTNHNYIKLAEDLEYRGPIL